jgi:ABC-type dipeptide/oligopeptide/nickel transport system permease component
MMQGIVLVVAAMVLITNLIADLAYALIDPRIRVA